MSWEIAEPLGMTPVPGLVTERYLLVGQSNVLGASSQVTPMCYNAMSLRTTGGWVGPGINSHEFFASSRVTTGVWSSVSISRSPRRCIFFSMAVGGTRLDPNVAYDALGVGAARWDPDAGNALPYGTGITTVAGDLWRNALDNWTDNRKPNLSLACWCQGEWEASSWGLAGLSEAEAYDSYKKAIINLAIRVYTDFGCKLMVAPTGLGLYISQPAYTALVQPIHDAQIDACGECQYLIRGPSMDDLDMLAPSNSHVYDVLRWADRWSTEIAKVLG